VDFLIFNSSVKAPEPQNFIVKSPVLKNLVWRHLNLKKSNVKAPEPQNFIVKAPEPQKSSVKAPET